MKEILTLAKKYEYGLFFILIEVIGFQSSRKGDLVNLKTSETVIFNQASLNKGSAYDTTTGEFTAPTDGVYSFSWTTMSETEK